MEVLFSLILLGILGLFFWGIVAILFSKGEVYYSKVEDYDFDAIEHENYWRGYDGRSQ